MLTSETPISGVTATDRKSQISVRESASDAAASSAWHHLVLEIAIPEVDGWLQAMQDRLDQVAAQGWELVALTPVVMHLPAPGGEAKLGARDTLLATFKQYTPA